MNTMMKCMSDVSSIETDMNIRHEYTDEMHVGHQLYGDRHEHTITKGMRHYKLLSLSFSYIDIKALLLNLFPVLKC